MRTEGRHDISRSGRIRKYVITTRSLFFQVGEPGPVLSRKHNIATQNPFETVTVPEFCEIARVGRSKGYEILNSGVVKSVLVEGSRLVLSQTWYDHLAQLLEQQQTFTPGRSPNLRRELADQPPIQASPPPLRRCGRPPKYPRPGPVGPPVAPQDSSRPPE